MFDPITTALIRRAPAFEGLDLEKLPKRLTQAFADIVSARIRLRGGDQGTETLSGVIAELRRIAAAQEAYVALLPDRDNRAAAAFVAAAAHQTVSLGRSPAAPDSRVSAGALSPEVCATLLFLLSESHADAAEAAKRIVPHTDASPTERALLLAIQNLAQGRLFDVVVAGVPDIAIADIGPAELALDGLRSLLLQGVVGLARRLRRRHDPDLLVGEAPSSIFQRVRALCSERIDGVDGIGPVLSLFPGPLHLANLLLSLEGDLIATALYRIATPGGLSEQTWSPILRRMARTRPFLWRNHRQAIESGYLEQGVSSAISFPTGGGKSTLAELKIATTLLRGEQVVFLAPTHALVGQTQRALKSTFQDYSILADVDEDVTAPDEVALAEVTVMTPERCLMLLSVQPEAFASVGLVVFDECHLIHAREDDRSRRALDAMLALLNLIQVAPSTDLLLLSAMMKNTAEIAGWVEHLTGRPCLALDLAWKPTRQARGCVVYPADEIETLQAKLNEEAAKTPGVKRDAPSALEDELLATPYGLFSLLQTWSTTDREDYALLQLLTEPQQLTTGNKRFGGWYPTPNGNHTSSAIAAAAVQAGMKTLVFVQSTVFSESCVKKFRTRIPAAEVVLTDDERKWHALAAEELGGPQYCFLKLDPDGVLRSGAASHHGLLLREERELHEGLFRRRDGVRVLFATSTLAQGMNLPSELVIITGDSRFDPDGDKMKKLEAHELLNAAGRAGRAGEGAQGFVLLVPTKVISFDNQKSEISDHWLELQAIFEQADQCLCIDDPLEDVLDQIHNGITLSGNAGYLLSKLPLSIAGAIDDPGEAILRRSFAAFRALAAGKVDWLDSRVATALANRTPVTLAEHDRWIERVASSTGLRVTLLQDLVGLLDAKVLDGEASSVIEALFAWLAGKPWLLMEFLRPENLEGLFGKDYKALNDDTARGVFALPALKLLLPLWMAGRPLAELEAAFLSRTNRLGECRKARHFVSRLVPDLAFLAGLPGLLLASRRKATGDETLIPIVLATLGSMVREGSDSPEALATRFHGGREVSRVAARATFEGISHQIGDRAEQETFEFTMERVRTAILLSSFEDLT